MQQIEMIKGGNYNYPEIRVPSAALTAVFPPIVVRCVSDHCE